MTDYLSILHTKLSEIRGLLARGLDVVDLQGSIQKLEHEFADLVANEVHVIKSRIDSIESNHSDLAAKVDALITELSSSLTPPAVAEAAQIAAATIAAPATPVPAADPSPTPSPAVADATSTAPTAAAEVPTDHVQPGTDAGTPPVTTDAAPAAANDATQPASVTAPGSGG